ncbi:MAG: DinB family protein [Gemmatimonadaceae bacterium]
MSVVMLRSLYAHMEWANARVMDALREAPGGDAAALEQMGHILGAEHVWLSRIEGRKATVAVWPALTLEECQRIAGANAAAFGRLFDGETADTLSRDVPYTNSAGIQFTSRVEDILTHVALHGTYHRGQLSTMMRRGGGEPAPTDYIAFKRGAPAAAQKSR